MTRSHVLALDRPVVTFTFDDIPVSAATTGAGILEAHGLRGSFFVCGGLAGQDWELYPLASLDLVGALSGRGHEIGCHTAHHGRVGDVSRRAFLADLDRNAEILAPLTGDGGLQSFAYPYGAMRLDVKLAIQDRFRGSRGIHDGLNHGRIDLGRIRADPLEIATADEAVVDQLLDDTVRQGGWRVFYSHDVAETPTRFGVTPRLLGYAVAGALRRGCAVLTMAAALDAAGVPKVGGAHATSRRSAR